MESLNAKDKRKNTNKNDIVDAAEKLFFTKGYNNSTMDQVAREADLQRDLYSYFKSKEDIYEKIIQRGYEVLNKIFLDTLEGKKDSTELFKNKGYGIFFNKF